MSTSCKCAWTVGALLILLLVDGHLAKVPIYRDTCNETIFVDSAGKLVYNHNPTVSQNQCYIFIETNPGYHIGYAFERTTAFREIVVQNDNVFYSCTDGIERFGCVNSNYTDRLQTTRSNTLTIKVHGDDLVYFKFELVFFTFHYSICYSFEERCYSFRGSNLNDSDSACIYRTLACDKNFCDTSSSKCSDIVVDDFSFDFKGSLIAAIALLCIILVPLITLTTCMIIRRFCKKQEPEEDTPTRARRIFAAILSDAEENAGYETGSIDPSKFDPPPDYGSLEQLDGAGSSSVHCDNQLSQISTESPPCYSDVMSNSTEYLVSNHI